NTLLQQLTGKLVKRERPSNREANLEEWIPPSSSKKWKPTASLNLKMVSWATDLQLTPGHTGRNPISESTENSENHKNLIQKERLSPVDAARILTPLFAGVTKALFLNNTVTETCSHSDGKNLLSSGNYSGDILQGPSGWSPELFRQAQTPFSNKPK
ncbi:hypothetical protein N310_12179, partial [Acanthisitta chloris]